MGRAKPEKPGGWTREGRCRATELELMMGGAKPEKPKVYLPNFRGIVSVCLCLCVLWVGACVDLTMILGVNCFRYCGVV